MRFRERPARAVVASVALAAVPALVGVGAAVARSGDTTEEPTPGRSAEDHGRHEGWAKLVANDSNGKHKGWDQHDQHGGAPVSGIDGGAAHGQSGEDHGQAGQDHGKAGEKGLGAQHGQAGQDHGQAGRQP